MSGGYKRALDWQDTVRLSVRSRTRRREVVDYAVALLALGSDGWGTIRVYDGAHGVNDMHRYTRSGAKQPAVVFHECTLGEGMRAAVRDVRGGWAEMIEGWRR